MTREQITELYRKELLDQGLADWTVELFSPDEWEAHKTEVVRQDRKRMVNQSIERGPMLQSLVGQWIEQGTTLIEPDQGDFWTNIEKDLEAKGWVKAFKAKEDELLDRVETPRVYPCPVPRYELQEQDGVMCLVTVGYWPAGAHVDMEVVA